MADTKISAMTAASALGGTEDIAGVQSGANVRLTPNQIVTYFLSVARTFLGLVTLSAGGDNTPATTPSTTAIGYLGAPINSQSAAYGFLMTDAGKVVYHPDADTTARTFTIPANSGVAFPIGTIIGIQNGNGAGVITLAITTDTLRWGSSTGSRSIAANGTCSLLKVTSTVWRLTGDGIT